MLGMKGYFSFLVYLFLKNNLETNAENCGMSLAISETFVLILWLLHLCANFNRNLIVWPQNDLIGNFITLSQCKSFNSKLLHFFVVSSYFANLSQFIGSWNMSKDHKNLKNMQKINTYCEETVLCHKKRHAVIDLIDIQKNSNDVTTNQNISANCVQ